MSFVKGIDPRQMMAMKKNVHGDAKQFAVCRLYSGSDNGWQFEAIGALFLVEDRETEAPTLFLVNMNTNAVIWSHELYKGVRILKLHRFFLAFEGSDTFFGLSFADVCDASAFKRTCSSCVKNSRAKKKKGSKSKKKPSDKKGGDKKKKKEDKKKKKGFLGGIFSGREKKKPMKISIGQPRNFKHSMHIGVVAGRGFVHDNLPSEWRDIFEDAGIKKEDYEDPKKAKRMMKAMRKFKRKKEGKPSSAKKKKKKKAPKKKKKKKKAQEESDDDCAPPPPDMDDFGSSRGGGGGGGDSDDDAPPAPPGAGGLGGGGGGRNAPPADDERGDLLASIRKFKTGGGQLKKVDKKEYAVKLDVKNMSGGDRTDLMSVLKQSILQRKDNMEGSDDDDDDSEGWSDEEEEW